MKKEDKMSSYKVFTVNPGSTSTKIALFQGEEKIFSANVSHDAKVLAQYQTLEEQLKYREETIRELTEHGYHIQRNGVSNYTLNKKSRIIFLDNIPDQTDDIKSTKDIPSWKRMCFCILKNDHICRFMGFGLTRQQQKRIEAIRKKYKSIEEFDYGI